MIKTEIRLPLDYSGEDIKKAIAEHLPVGRDEIRNYKLIRRELVSLDGGFFYNVRIGVEFSPEREAGLLKMKKKVSLFDEMTFETRAYRGEYRPIVCGFGPSGIFAALVLSEAGARPIVIERGLATDEREKKVNLFKTLGVIDPECNVQYGEGGAGTYSDGKLKVGGMDKYKLKVLTELVSSGAPEEIIYTVGAHLGTDKLSDIVKRMRERIVSLGGEVHFSTKLTDVKIKDGKVKAVIAERGGERIEFPTDTLILASGHSAKDVFELLLEKGASLIPRGFGIGVRIEHPREYINDLVWGKDRPDSLGAASYHLVTHLEGGRSVYSFCMCPGGVVVPAASEAGGIVTNGMSEYRRDAENSNAAFLVSVTPEDFPSDSPLAGIALQREIERRAYSVGGGNYKAPAIKMGDFLEGRSPTSNFSVKPSYAIGVEPHSLLEYLPSYITDSLRAAIGDFDDWMRGFKLSDAPMTGPETRSTSPIRVLRDESFTAIGIKGLYPIGEGAGYSGGIVSSARDGVMVAESVILRSNDN